MSGAPCAVPTATSSSAPNVPNAAAGKVLGLSEKEVRAELLALLQGAAKASPASNGMHVEEKGGRAARKSEPAATARSGAKKSTAKRAR